MAHERAPLSGPVTDRMCDNGAIGARGLHSDNGRTNRIAWDMRKTRQSLALKKAKLAAGVIAILLVGVIAVVLVQEHTPSTARSARPYTLDYLLWTAYGEQHGGFGTSVSSAGDVNDDGYDDVVIGSPHYVNGQGWQGCAYLYPGSSTGLSASPSWKYESDDTYARLGCSVSSAGDVNADGYDDVVVGAYGYGFGHPWDGRAYVFLGSSAGLSATPSWIADGDQQGGSLFGWSVSSAGDVNGDGYDDVVIGAPHYFSYPLLAGRAYGYLGSSAGLSSTPSWTFDGDKESALLGWSVSSAGDVDNDGYDDVIVGAPGWSSDSSVVGRACLLVGSSIGLSATPSWTAVGDQAAASFGASVSSAGDVNNDGYDDVVVGAGDYDNGQTDEGRAFLYLGSSTGLDASPSWTAESDQANAGFGSSVSSAGDVENDGYDDVIVGAPGRTLESSRVERTYLFVGSSIGLSATPSWTAASDQFRASFGASVSSAGDVNGDGNDEVIVGAPGYYVNFYVGGRAYLYGELAPIPEFNVLLISVVGTVAIVVALRRLHPPGKESIEKKEEV